MAHAAQLLPRRGLGGADDHDDRLGVLAGELADAADHLAVEALGVEEALAGHHHVGRDEAVVEVDVVGHQVEAAEQASPERRQPARQPARRAAADERAHVDAELLLVAVGEAVETGGEHRHHGRRSALLRGEQRRRVEEQGAHVTRHLQVDRPETGGAAQHLDRTESAVGARRAAEADHDRAGTCLDRAPDQLAGAGRGGGERVVARRAPRQRQTTGARHLDDRGPAMDAPCRVDRFAEWPGHP